MSATRLKGPKLFGMLELDAADTVVYSRLEASGRGDYGPATDLRGRCLFDGFASFSNGDDLRRHIGHFRDNGERAEGFDFTCCYEDGDVPVRVMLARVLKVAGGTKSVLMHVRPRLCDDDVIGAATPGGSNSPDEKR